MKIVVAFMVLVSVVAASAQVRENAHRQRLINKDNPDVSVVVRPVTRPHKEIQPRKKDK